MIDDKTDDIELPSGMYGVDIIKENEDKKEVEEKSEHDKLKEFFFSENKVARCECGVGHVDAGKHSDYCPAYKSWEDK